MKFISIKTLAGLLLPLLLSAPVLLAQPSPNLLSAQRNQTPNYWCTWNLQYFVGGEKAKQLADLEGSEGAVMARNSLTERMLFSEKGWANVVFPAVKKDLFLVLDDGWDVPPDHFRPYLGSQIVDSTKFPSCTGTPANRLKTLNELAKKSGWRGAGIWVCAQEFAADPDRKNYASESEYVRHYWTERLHWSRDAGIGYWKVDWGNRTDSDEFRRMLTTLAATEAPALLIEHTVSLPPLNTASGGMDTTRGKKGLPLIRFSQVFRTYDVTTQLSVASTLERVGYYLRQADQQGLKGGLLHCEDELYVAAVLGCVVGVMRFPADRAFVSSHPLFYFSSGEKFLPSRFYYNHLAEVNRAVNWQKIMPALGVGQTRFFADDSRLRDNWHFEKGDTWDAGLIGKTIWQEAPARMSRGMPLPEVSSRAEKPFVIAAQHPNGSVAVATLGRTQANEGYQLRKATVGIQVKSADNQAIGIFGHYDTLSVTFDKPIKKATVWGQDLASSRATDITRLVKITGNKLVIPGAVIEKVGRSAQASEDQSEPGLVISIR